MDKPLTRQFSLSVQYASTSENLPARAQFRRWIKIAMRRDATLTLRLVDEPEGRELNKKYRGKNYATNVLTFVYSSTDGVCGDVVICAPVVEKEAALQHKNLLAHYAHLAIHAALHLQGYDHQNDDAAAEMEAIETGLMLKLRHPDPYRTIKTKDGRARK
jgi:probable rRNA maturation factor